MKNKLTLPAAFAVTLAACALVLPATAHAGDKIPADLQAKAKITQAEAEKTALAAVPTGVVKSVELENEDGGLRWSFDLKTPGTKNITEVGVDAMTGKVVENKVENAKDEAKEKDEEKEEKGH